ncbi:T9SS type B sorting domain-containing protein [Flavobacterium ustbae]|uniref:T9SS type B sorting domain-containing protein n=1 Tax=Flavobacterium ustbae TaxID=2488790 RepID=UPI000F7A7C15|nr:T9SS type B sorting domain-containing protein [Flavobacterium ustbae]
MRIIINQKNKFSTAISFLFFLFFQYTNAQITLTNNIGTTLVKTDMFGCDESESWSRLFKMSDFGIKANEQFIIKSGQIGIAKSNIKTELYVTVYSVDVDYPEFINTPYHTKVLGTATLGKSPIVTGTPQIVQAEFDAPIIVPAGIERILVTVSKMKDIYDTASAEILIAGTELDKGESIYSGCGNPYGMISTKNLPVPVPNANFFITLTGDTFNVKNTGSITRLSHNICDDVIETGIHSCSGSGQFWARDFTLKDFGISNNEEFVINSGQVGLNGVTWGIEVTFNIYKIDNNFPASFSTADLIGSSQTVSVPYVGSTRDSRVIQVDFKTPIVIPAGVERILVEVYKGLVPNSWGLAFIAGSAQDNGISWERGGCKNLQDGSYPSIDKYVNVASFGYPNANFYINVTGNVKNVSNHFEMNFSNICSEFLKEFSVDDPSRVASIVWNFGDPASGVDNVSTDLSPFHDFSADGKYTVTAIVTAKDGSVETLSEIIDAKEPPKAYGINNVYACEDIYGTGISKSFDVATITQQVLGGQTDKDVTFIDGKGNKYSSLPNPFTNTIKERETITVRVSHEDNLCCYSETTFDLIVNPLPNLSLINDLFVCDNGNGFARFDLQPLKTTITGTAVNLNVEFYHQNGQKIQGSLNTVTNLVAKEEIIKVRVINSDTNCSNESTFKLIVSPVPVANSLQQLIGCDDNNDGISEYFDTSNVESTVLGNQQGMKVSYFDKNGNQLLNGLANPYTNTIKNQETITVRVTNILTNCYAETALVLKTSSQPQINKPANKYTCDEGNGFGDFDMTNIDAEIIGNQTGLKIMYFDTSGNQLTSPLPILFRNTTPGSQTIKVRVENEINTLCYSETDFDLIVNNLPSVNIEKTYFLCNLEPSLHVNVASDLDTYIWKFEGNNIVSNTYSVDLVNAGRYTLVVGKIENNIYCENNFEFELIRSVLPKIKDVKYKELSDDNFIQIIPSFEGNLEYSIDGINYQDSNYFSNIQGGTYISYIRDKEGCGKDSKEVTVIDYPKFFTPNNDGYNDLWQITTIQKYPNSKISIFDRYGKLLKELSANDLGWDGFYGGTEMPSDDYWFKANFDNKVIFSGHFSLKR